MTSTEGTIEQATALLASVTVGSELDDERLVRMLALAEVVGRHADRIRVAIAAEVGERSRHELGSDGLAWRFGQRRPGQLIEQLALVSAAEAGRRMRLGAAVASRKAGSARRRLPGATPITSRGGSPAAPLM